MTQSARRTGISGAAGVDCRTREASNWGKSRFLDDFEQLTSAFELPLKTQIAFLRRRMIRVGVNRHEQR
jgi:hypothetical protein